MLGNTNRWAVPFYRERRARHWRFGSLALLGAVVMLFSSCGGTTGTSTLPPATVASATPNVTTTQATPGTPVSAAGLPMTVTANGVDVTLGFIDTTDTATAFSFSVKLPPDQVGAQTTGSVGPPDVHDIQIDGMPPTNKQPSGTQRNAQPGETEVPFSVEYQAPFPADQTVTLTIARLSLPKKTVTGPWVFQVTRQMVAQEPQPTPAGPVNRFMHLSVTEAQKLVDFPIIEPNPLPGTLWRPEFSVFGYSVGDSGSALANYVMLNYVPNPPVTDGVWLVETSNQDAVPTVSNGTYSMILPSPTSNGKPTTGTIDDGSLTTLDVDGVSVTTFTLSRAEARQVYYSWTHAGVGYWIRYTADTANHGNASPSPQAAITDDDLRQMVTSIIDQTAGTASSQASPTNASTAGALPTPDQSGRILGITFAQAQQLTPFSIFMPTYIPPSLKYGGVDVKIPIVAPKGVPKDTPTQANLGFDPSGSQGFLVTIMETQLDLNPNNVGGAEVPVTNAAGTPTVMPADGVVSTLTIDGTSVTRHDVANQDGKIFSVYFWKQGKTTMMLSAILDYPASQQDIEQMIASMIAQGS